MQFKNNPNCENHAEIMPMSHSVPKKADLGLVIINWNSGSLLQKCLTSIQKASQHNGLSIVVIDNASEDGSAQNLTCKFPFQVVHSQENMGFGAGCNLGARQIDSDYFLFLNPDIEFLDGSLDSLIAFLNSPAMQLTYGILGVQLLGEDGVVSKSIARFPRFRDFFPRMLALDKIFPKIFLPHYCIDLDYSQSQVVDQVPGGCFLVRRAVFENLKGFDEQFFMYYEDLDFALRANKMGWKTFFLADVKVYHKGGGTTEAIKDRRLCYSLFSRVKYTAKHFGKKQALVLLVGIYGPELISRLVWAGIKFSLQDFQATFRGYALLTRALPQLFKEIY